MNSIEVIYNDLVNRGVSGNNLQREMFRALREQGYTNQEILNLLRQSIRQHQEPVQSTEDTITTNITDTDCINRTDPFTQEPISSDRLVSVIENGKKYCFDPQSLYLHLKTSSINPYTKSPFPEDFIQYVKSIYPSIEIYSDNGKIIIDKFTQLGDVILDVLRGLPQNFPESFKFNVLLNGRSLYEEDLMEAYPFENGDEVYTVAFRDDEEADNFLVNLLMFLRKKKTSSQSYEGLHKLLGSYLGVTPVVITPDGIDMPFNEDDTMYDVIKKIYELLGGFQKIKEKKLVLDDGRPLTSFNLRRRVVDVIPGEIVRMIDVDEPDMIDVEAISSMSLLSNDEYIIPQLREGVTGILDITSDIPTNQLIELHHNSLINQNEFADILISDLSNNLQRPFDLIIPYGCQLSDDPLNCMPIFYSKIIRFFFTADEVHFELRDHLEPEPLRGQAIRFPLDEVTNLDNFLRITAYTLDEAKAVLRGEAYDIESIVYFDSVESYINSSEYNKMKVVKSIYDRKYNPRLLSYIKEHDDNMDRVWRAFYVDDSVYEFFDKFEGRNMFLLLLNNAPMGRDDITRLFLERGNLTDEQINDERLTMAGSAPFLNDPRLKITPEYLKRVSTNKDDYSFMVRLTRMAPHEVVELAEEVYDTELSNYLLSHNVVVVPPPSPETTDKILLSRRVEFSTPESRNKYEMKVGVYVNQPGLSNDELQKLLNEFYQNREILRSIVNHPNFAYSTRYISSLYYLPTVIDNRLVSIDKIVSWKIPIDNLLSTRRFLTVDGLRYLNEILEKMNA